MTIAYQRIKFRHLQCFLEVARQKSVVKAAVVLAVTQPAVSKKVRLLQEEVGLPLLEHIGKRFYLTQAGSELLATCGDWLDTWSRFEQTIADLLGNFYENIAFKVVVDDLPQHGAFFKWQ